MKQYQEQVYWHIRRMVTYHADADDVVQNVFIKVYRYIEQFKGDSKIYTWLFRIATNESITFLNKRKKRQSASIDSEDFQVQLEAKADLYFDGDAAQQKLKQALYLLPEKQKAVFSLRYYDNMSYKDMSVVLETSVGALKASYHHAAKKIEEYLRNGAE